MPAIGHIHEFDSKIETFTAWRARLCQYFVANGIKDDKRVAALIATLGVQGYKTLQDLFAPENPTTKTFQVLCDALEQHHSPKPLQLAERFRLHKCSQSDTQTVTEYIATLRSLSLNCGYDNAVLSDTLRDIFIVGLRSSHIQRELISKPDTLTFAEACDTAKKLEAASNEVSLLSGKRAQPVHKLHSRKTYKHEKTPQHSTSARHSTPTRHDYTDRPCFRCTGRHLPDTCYHRNSKCDYCKKTGHIERACIKKANDTGVKPKVPLSKPKHQAPRTPKHVHNVVSEPVYASSDDEYIQHLKTDTNSDVRKADKFWVTPKICGTPVDFEIDTGSKVTVIPREHFLKFFPNATLAAPDISLRNFDNAAIHVHGTFTCDVKIYGQKKRLKLYVTDKGNNPLFGRDWFRAFKLNWEHIHAVHVAAKINDTAATHQSTQATLSAITQRYSQVFEPGFGNFRNTNAQFFLRDGAQPVFARARNVPYSLRDKVDAELDRLEKEKIITPVTHSDWASPICCVPKSDGRVRICGDFKATLNPQLKPEQHPTPRVEDIFAQLAGGEKFTKLDLTQAYLSINVDPEHRKYVTINTQKGLYQYNRVPYGVTDSGAKFQKPLDQLLTGAQGAQAMVDDVIITGRDDAEHLRNLEEVLQRLQNAGLKANKYKCSFLQDSITFCGHVVTKDGIKQEPEKQAAIINAPKPQNQKELLSFIGLIGFYRKFIPNISTLQKPLTELAHATKWSWTTLHDRALENIKRQIASDRVLTHYDPNLPLRVAVDASPVGLGCVMSHLMPDHTERPVLFLSRALTDTERGYSHLHKEALAIFWAVKKLYHYLFQREFTLITDNKPLAAILKPDKNIPEYSALRLQRYAIFLSGLNYKLETRSTKQHGNCDALSRMPLPHNEPDAVDESHVYNIQQLEAIPVQAHDIAQHTKRDKTMSRVYTYTQSGQWDDDKGPFAPYYRRKDELSTQNGILFWQNRVVIPPALRRQIIEELHVAHPGVVRMKAIARSYVWFPGIDDEIENHVKSCAQCALNQQSPPESQLHNWRYPDAPLHRVHIDFAGPIDGKQLLVIVDAYTKWPHVEILNTTATSGVIEKLRSFCATFGLIKTLVSDNGSCFTSEEFRAFCQNNGIKHITGAPYHSRTNGQAEIVVKQVKNALKRVPGKDKSMRQKLDEFLFRYRVTPHATTGEKPCVLMFNRTLRTRFDLLRPTQRDYVTNQQSKSEKHTHPLRKFEPKQHVMMRDFSYRRERPWTYAEVVRKTGPVSYDVMSGDKIHRRHADQLSNTRARGIVTPPPVNFADDSITSRPIAPTTPPRPLVGSAMVVSDQHFDADTPESHACEPPTRVLRRSRRATTNVQRYGAPVPWRALKK